MCCILPSVRRVSNTSLFARLSERGQLLVYQMTFAAKERVAMILPIPIELPTREDAVRFIDLKGYPEFFAHLNNAFPLRRRGGSKTALATAVGSAPRSPLRVEQVGDFEASFVPSPADFGRLDPRFTLPKAAFEAFPEYRDFGFVVFQFQERGGTPHPMAFEFPTRLVNKLFYPTVHIHDGKIHNKENFDHTLYFQDGGGAHGEASAGVAKNYVQIEKAQGIVEGDAPLRRVKLAGLLPNTDTILDTTLRNPKRATWAGAGIGAALLGGWLLQLRRGHKTLP